MGIITKEVASQIETIVYDKIIEFQKLKGYPPTIREVQIICGFKSSSTAYNYFKRLENKGLIIRSDNMPRAIKISRHQDNV